MTIFVTKSVSVSSEDRRDDVGGPSCRLESYIPIARSVSNACDFLPRLQQASQDVGTCAASPSRDFDHRIFPGIIEEERDLHPLPDRPEREQTLQHLYRQRLCPRQDASAAGLGICFVSSPDLSHR